MSRHTCKCSKQSNTVGGDMHRVGVQTDHKKKKQVALLVYVARHFRSSLHRHRINAQWSPLYCLYCLIACCLLNFIDANNVPCCVCCFFRHSGHGSSVQVLPHLIRTTQEPCPRPPFQGKLGIEGVEPLDELEPCPGLVLLENTLKLNYRQHCHCHFSLYTTVVTHNMRYVSARETLGGSPGTLTTCSPALQILAFH